MQFRTQLRREVRILLVGEPKVGKTSVILSLVSEDFSDDGIPARCEEITIPADITPEMVPTVIVDFSCEEQSESELEDEIRRANVICIVYSVEDDESIEKISTFWIPTIRSTLGLKHKTPIILVGNKVDLVDYTTMEIVVSLMNEFPEIETCIECSARTLRNVSELFFYAQKAVLHPTSPLYNSDKKELTDKCKVALERIFRIFDLNNDGSLDDMEMYGFQKFCYDAPLQPQGLDSVKLIIQRNSVDGVFNNGITLHGFLILHTLFIQRGKHETTWTALRKFGYNDDLNICNDYLCPLLNVPFGSTTELNQVGVDFLTSLFIKYDKDRDRCLSPEELSNLFSICPSIPFSPSSFLGVSSNDRGYLTYGGFICQWALTTLLDVNRTMEHMAYLGFPITEDSNQLKALTVTEEKKFTVGKKQSSRNVYRCHVIGAKNVGKTTLCQGLLGRTLQMTNKLSEREKLPKFVVNIVQVYGVEKTLVLQDIDLNRVVDILPTSEVVCDVACLVYDTSDSKSFEFIARTYLNYYQTLKIPVLIVGNKIDCGEVLQDYGIQPRAFCSRYKLPPPHMFSTSDKIERELYIKLATMSAFPRFQAAWMVFYRNSHFGKMGLLECENISWMKRSLGVVLVGSLAYFIYKILTNEPKITKTSTT